MHTRGSQLVPELLLKLSVTYSAYVGNSTCTTACAETIQYFCLHNKDSLNICIKKFDATKRFFDKITAF